MFYRLWPDVAGGFGELSELDTTTAPPTVHRVHYVIEGWSGDCLLETTPVYLVERSIGEKLLAQGFVGFELRQATVTTSDVFEELQPETRLPEFLWLHVTGVAGRDDLGLENKTRLVVKEEVLSVLQKGGLENCDIEKLAPSA